MTNMSNTSEVQMEKAGFSEEPDYQGYEQPIPSFAAPPPLLSEYPPPYETIQPTQPLATPHAVESQPVVVLMVPGPKPEYEASRCYLGMTLVIACIHLVIITTILCLQIVLDVYKSPLSIAQVGIIVGVPGLVLGLLCLASYRQAYKNKGVTASLLAFSIIVAFLAAALVIVALTDLIVWAIATVFPSGSGKYRNSRDIVSACNITMMVLAFCELLFCVWSSILACIGMCDCCKHCCYKNTGERQMIPAQPGAAYSR